MSLRTRMLPVADRLRALAGPGRFDVRTVRLTVVTRTWSGGRRGADPIPPDVVPYRDERLELPAIYRVRELTSREVSGSGGRYEMGQLRVGPITPAFLDRQGRPGGFSVEQLKPVVTQRGTEILYVLEGAVSGEYALVEFDSAAAFSYFLVLSRRETTP